MITKGVTPSFENVGVFLELFRACPPGFRLELRAAQSGKNCLTIFRVLELVLRRLAASHFCILLRLVYSDNMFGAGKEGIVLALLYSRVVHAVILIIRV